MDYIEERTIQGSVFQTAFLGVPIPRIALRLFAVMKILSFKQLPYAQIFSYFSPRGK